MIKGEPAFQPGDNEPSSVDKPQPTEHSGQKDIPEVYVVRHECRVYRGRMTLDVYIQNNSREHIFLDDINLFGRIKEIQRDLNPGEKREFQIYNGPALVGAFNDRAWLRYRNQSNDYFSTHHDLDAQTQPDGSQWIKRFDYIPPVKDI